MSVPFSLFSYFTKFMFFDLPIAFILEDVRNQVNLSLSFPLTRPLKLVGNVG